MILYKFQNRGEEAAGEIGGGLVGDKVGLERPVFEYYFFESKVFGFPSQTNGVHEFKYLRWYRTKTIP